MDFKIDSFDQDFDGDSGPMKGSNFLVSAVMMLRRQRKDLESELVHLKERVGILEQQNAALLNVSADRLLERRG